MRCSSSRRWAIWTEAARERYKDGGRRYPGDLTDAEWGTIEPVLSCYATLTVDLREMVNACLYLEKAGCPWRSLPKEFGPWQTVRTWHDRVRADGVWSDMAALLVRAVRQKQGRAPEPTTALLDSQRGAPGLNGPIKIDHLARRRSFDGDADRTATWQRAGQRSTGPAWNGGTG